MPYYTLGIETSCDETAAAVVEDGTVIRSNIVASQVELHKKYGGVVPELASRRHLETVLPVVVEALEQAGITYRDLSAVAASAGPGLVGALLVGVAVAKAIAYARDLPLVGVNHLEGHIYANFLDTMPPEFPFICLVVSGGHTDLIHASGHGDLELLGMTRDDAAGEAFDKVARVFGLGYPGGPQVDALARGGNPAAVDFPRAFLEEGSHDFSFSGLKTAVLLHVEGLRERGADINLPDLAASFQQAVADVLVAKTIQAARQRRVRRILLAGGVAANSALRRAFAAAAGTDLEVRFPPPALCTDNAAMIASAGYFAWRGGRVSSLDLNAVPNLRLGSTSPARERGI